MEVYLDSTKFKGGCKSANVDEISGCLIFEFDKCRINKRKWFDICRGFFNRSIIIFDVYVNGVRFKVPVLITAINSNTHYHRNIKFTAQSAGRTY